VTPPGQDFVTHLHLAGKIAVVAFVRVGCSTAFVVEVSENKLILDLDSNI